MKEGEKGRERRRGGAGQKESVTHFMALLLSCKLPPTPPPLPPQSGSWGGDRQSEPMAAHPQRERAHSSALILKQRAAPPHSSPSFSSSIIIVTPSPPPLHFLLHFHWPPIIPAPIFSASVPYLLCQSDYVFVPLCFLIRPLPVSLTPTEASLFSNSVSSARSQLHVTFSVAHEFPRGSVEPEPSQYFSFLTTFVPIGGFPVFGHCEGSMRRWRNNSSCPMSFLSIFK